MAGRPLIGVNPPADNTVMAKRKPVTPTYVYSATVLRVVDGDGVDVRVDVGFRMWAEMPMRLLGLNAPEKNSAAGKAAKAFTEAWCEAHPQVVVVTERNPEKYGRWLATISDGDAVLNDALLTAGHALPWDGRGPRPVPAV
jgi:micrococcal nuclease